LQRAGAGGQLKSTFMVKPGADPNQIRLAYRGATGVRLTEAGQLEVSTPVGSFADDRPYAYQDGSGDRTEVPVAFALAAPAAGAQGYSFRVGGYDRSKTPGTPLPWTPKAMRTSPARPRRMRQASR
jgi:hypothetical protein